jgi:hypothetical protein
MRAVCCLPLVSNVDRKIRFRSGLSKLRFNSLLWPMRARGLLCCNSNVSFSLGMLQQCYLFEFATDPYSVTVMTI